MSAEITVYGNLGRAPELRHTQSGIPVLGLSVAHNLKDKDGNQTGTEWFDVPFWREDAEAIHARGLEKGTFVKVCGRFEIERYEKDGETGIRLKVVDAALKVYPKRDGETARTPDPQAPSPRPAAPQQAPAYNPDDDPFGDQ